MNTSIYLLAGDLGGTKTLLALYRYNKQLSKVYQKRYLSNDWDSFEAILKSFQTEIPKDLEKPSFGCIAVAGRVVKGSAKITNLPWQLYEENLCATSGLNKLEIVNDFAVLFYGLPFLKHNQKVDIQVPQKGKAPEGPVAIIGAGTGLGIAKSLSNKYNTSIIPSEGGHSEFAPRSEDEWRMTQWLKYKLGLQRLSVERIVSGSGLGKIALWKLEEVDARNHPLYQFSKEWENNNFTNPDFPKLVSEYAESGDPIMRDVLKIWLSAYGSAAGDLALQELCTGGLWLSGGTAAKQIDGLRSKSFLEAFRNKGRFRSFLEELPVMALIDPEAGLFSAACRARSLAESSEKLE